MTDEITHLDDRALTELEADAEAGQHMRAWRIVGQLVREVRRLSDKNRELNRRCQQMRSALPDWRAIRDVAGEMRGGSFGRKLLAYGIVEAKEENDEHRKAIEALEGRMERMHEENQRLHELARIYAPHEIDLDDDE